MAKKSYAQRNAESIAKYGKSLYERRIEKGVRSGLSRSQAAGHARTKQGEQPVSAIKGTRARTGPPKITHRFAKLSNGTRIVQGRKTDQILRSLNSQIRTKKDGRLSRIYFQVWDNNKGKYVNVYYGRTGPKGPHGITVEEFLRRVDEKMMSGESSDLDEAIRDTISEDSSEGAGVDSPEGEEAPADFEQFTMYIR